MIAHSFPPEGSAGTYRPLRFVRHLPALGWRPIVISSAKDHYDRYDPGLLTLIPSGTEVVRVRGSDLWQAIQAWRARRQRTRSPRIEKAEGIPSVRSPSLRSSLRRSVEKLQAWRYHPDMAITWIRPAVAATVKVCLQIRPDVLWATVGPVSAAIVARRASERTDVPYVLDFRDPWGLNYYDAEATRPAWTKRADHITLYRVFERAQAVIFQFEAVAECYWRAYRGSLDPNRIHIIPNGYEGAVQESALPRTSKCTILYAGTLSTYYRFDSLLEALASLKRTDPAQAMRLRLLFVGDSMERLATELVRYRLTDLVEIMGPTSHADIARLQREAHALLILGRDSTRKGHELVAGAKLFEYLKARRPIIGVLPNDESRKILCRVGSSLLADVNSLPDIISVLRRLLEAWSQGALESFVPDRVSCEIYSAERQTEALVRALEGTPATERFIPGSVEVPPSLRADVCQGAWISSCRV
jgi:glycosyltransferase involved in cell wall biosynthesis